MFPNSATPELLQLLTPSSKSIVEFCRFVRENGVNAGTRETNLVVRSMAPLFDGFASLLILRRVFGRLPGASRTCCCRCRLYRRRNTAQQGTIAFEEQKRDCPDSSPRAVPADVEPSTKVADAEQPECFFVGTAWIELLQQTVEHRVWRGHAGKERGG
jgi:hypothetical protein